MGSPVATVVRLVFATAVLGIPTFLMGGTLPAAARVVTPDDDRSRTATALLYGLNTLGAVTGAALCTFYMLEVFGIRHSLWLACGVNLVVASLALLLARKRFADVPASDPAEPAADEPSGIGCGPTCAHPRFILVASGIAGFAFFLMEMVWYRMLAPLLGGSTYTFGLILTIALLGIGLGAAAYTLLFRRLPATLGAFALTCALEAICVALPYALGDRLALFAALTRPLGNIGFAGSVLSWIMVTSIVVLPAAFVAGVQFPLLIGIIGRGGHQIGLQVGKVCGSNTAGAILGSLAGGFGLLPLISAPGAWVAVTVILVGLCATSAWMAVQSRASRRIVAIPIATAVISAGLLITDGPTAVWRHGAVGFGRADIVSATARDVHTWKNTVRRWIAWEADGAESSVALVRGHSLSFHVNGKSDGDAQGDASTQVMAGMVGAILHPNPTRALVVGLGTGSSAGWLGAVESIEQVDVVEIEPVVVDVARECAAVNQNAVDNAKVIITIADAREVLQTTSQRYDLIFSEPSNPYRAGIASLYTQEFYQAVSGRLTDGGIFTQWLQGYELDAQTLETVYATLASVFPHVETWQGEAVDLLFLCSMTPIRYDVPALRKRIGAEPFRSALAQTWQVKDLEGFVSHFTAHADLTRRIVERSDAPLNTDDTMRVEYSFARTVGQELGAIAEHIYETAQRHGLHRPTLSGGTLRWAGVDDQRMQMYARDTGADIPLPAKATKLTRARAAAYELLRGDEINAQKALKQWEKQGKSVTELWELATIGEALASMRNEVLLAQVLEDLRPLHPTEAHLLMAQLRAAQERSFEAVVELEAGFERLRSSPWVILSTLRRALKTAERIAPEDRSLAERLHKALSQPFAVYLLDEDRRMAMLRVAKHVGKQQVADAFETFEPHVPWVDNFLRERVAAYEAVGHRLTQTARQALDEFESQTPAKLVDVAP